MSHFQRLHFEPRHKPTRAGAKQTHRFPPWLLGIRITPTPCYNSAAKSTPTHPRFPTTSATDTGPSTPNRLTDFTSSRFSPACTRHTNPSPASFHSPPSTRYTYPLKFGVI